MVANKRICEDDGDTISDEKVNDKIKPPPEEDIGPHKNNDETMEESQAWLFDVLNIIIIS